MIAEAFAKMKVDNLLPKEALGFSPELMEVIYQHGYNLFHNGKYQDALNIFKILRQLDITDTRYSYAVASCYHYLHQYLDAAENYNLTKYMDPFNPLPCFHLYDCYMQANYPISALQALQEALVLANKSDEYKELKKKIEIEQEHLKDFLKKMISEKK